MGRYTVIDDPGADAAVQEVLDRICRELRGLFQDRLRAVVLVGGYGRGEGGIYLESGEYRLVNDLDLLVFVNPGWKADPGLSGAMKDLARRLLPYGRGVKAIDLDLTSVWRQRFLASNTVGYYEVAAGHRVIYGDPKVSAWFRTLDPARLPVYEGANYFRNRGSGLLLPALYFMTDSLDDPQKRQNFQIEMHKACQAMGDALLLLAGQYHNSYRERLRRFNRLDSRRLGLPAPLRHKVAPLYEWGMTQKLTPDFTWPGDEEMVEKWFRVRDIFGEFFLWFEATRMGQKLDDWLVYADYLATHGAGEPWELKVGAFLEGLKQSWQRGRNNNPLSVTQGNHRRLGLAVMSLLLFSLTPDLRVKLGYVAMAGKALGQPAAEENRNQWQYLVGCYLASFYPKDVIHQALTPSGEGRDS